MLNKTRLRNFTILTGSTLIVLAATMISPALPGMAEAFADVPNVDFLVPLALTLPALFIAVGGLFAGPLLDRWGRKPVVLLSLLLYGFAGTAGFFLDSLTTILVSRAILGIAVAGKDGFFELNGEVHGYVERPAALFGVDDAYALYVEDESMVPRYMPGEIIFVQVVKSAQQCK